MADQNLVYYALVFAAVLALPVLRLVAKQLSQFSGTPNQGKLAGEYGGTSGVFSMAEVAKHNKQDDLWVRMTDANLRTSIARVNSAASLRPCFSRCPAFTHFVSLHASLGPTAVRWSACGSKVGHGRTASFVVRPSTSSRRRSCTGCALTTRW